MNEEQDVVGGKTSPGEHFDCEEVGACQDGDVGGDEILPGCVLAPLGCGLESRIGGGCSHSLIGNRVAENSDSSPKRQLFTGFRGRRSMLNHNLAAVN